VTLTDVTPGLQRALGLSVSEGAMVQDVTERSPAERAGLKPYDVITQVEGTKVLTNQELIRDIAARQPGTVARLDIIREGRRQSLIVKLAERPQRGEELDAAAGLEAPTRSTRQPEPQPPLGVTVRELDRAFVGRQEIPEAVEGVIVSRVDPTGAAHQVLRRGLVIMEINRRAVRTVAEYEKLVAAAKAGDVLAIYYYDPALAQRSLVTVAVD
jgi:serine protease Do